MTTSKVQGSSSSSSIVFITANIMKSVYYSIHISCTTSVLLYFFLLNVSRSVIFFHTFHISNEIKIHPYYKYITKKHRKKTFLYHGIINVRLKLFSFWRQSCCIKPTKNISFQHEREKSFLGSSARFLGEWFEWFLWFTSVKSIFFDFLVKVFLA